MIVRIFNIPTYNMSSKEFREYLSKLRENYKNDKYEDYFLPVSPDGTGPEVKFYNIPDNVEVKIEPIEPIDQMQDGDKM